MKRKYNNPMRQNVRVHSMTQKFSRCRLSIQAGTYTPQARVTRKHKNCTTGHEGTE